jgi:hypothetical protein
MILLLLVENTVAPICNNCCLFHDIHVYSSLLTELYFYVNLRDNIRMEIGWEGLDLTHLTQVRDQWWALVNTVKNFGFYKR